MREDELDVFATRRCAAKQNAGECACGVGRKFDGRTRHAVLQVVAALRIGRMGVDDQLASIDLVHDGRERRVAEPLAVIAGQHGNALGLKHIAAVSDFFQGAIYIEHRQGGKETKLFGIVTRELGAIFITDPCHPTHSLRITKTRGGCGGRCDRVSHAGLRHIVQGFVERPIAGGGLGQFAGFEFLQKRWRPDMVVHVDQVTFGFKRRRIVRLGHSARRQDARSACCQQSC